MTDSINLTGSGGGGKKRGMADKVPYSRDDRAFGDYENREVGLRLRKAQDDLTSALRAAAQNWKLRNSTEERQNRELQSAQKDLAGVLQSSVKAYNYRKNAEARQEKEKQKVEKENWSQLSVSAKIYKLKNATLQKQRKEEDRIYKSERAIAESLNRDFNAKKRYKDQQDRKNERASQQKFNDDYRQAQIDNRLFNEARNANRPKPGMFGRAALGVASLVGGQRFAGAAQRAFYGGNSGGGNSGGGLGADDAMALLSGAGTAGLVYEGGKLALNAGRYLAGPGAYGARASGWLGASSDYHGLRIGAAEMGRQGGFNGSQLSDYIYKNGKLSTELQGTGITSQSQAMDLLRTYGTVTNPNDAMNTLGDIGMGYVTNGLSHQRNAEMLSGARELGITSPTGDGGGKFKTRTDFLNTMTKAVAAGSAMGLDASRTSSVLEGMMRATISNGGASVNADETSNVWYKLASSGLAAGRTGEAQSSLMSGVAAAAKQTGYGGAGIQNTAHLMWYKKKFGEKGPASVKALAAAYGVDYDSVTQSEKDQLNDAFAAAQQGDIAGVGTQMQPFLTAHPEVAVEIAENYATNSGAPKRLQARVGANYLGVDDLTYRAISANSAALGTDSGNYSAQAQGIRNPENNAGFRNKNPTNLRPVGSSTEFRKFSTVRQGLAAGYGDMLSKYHRGDSVNTLGKLIAEWTKGAGAPKDYVDTITSQAHMGLNDVYNMDDPEQASRILRAVSKADSGMTIDPRDAQSAIATVLSAGNRTTTSGGNDIFGGQTAANNAVTQASESSANTQQLYVNEVFGTLTGKVNETTTALDRFINSLNGKGPSGPIPRLDWTGGLFNNR